MNLEKTSIPIKVVGSSVFGRYSKISSETTYNMIISDDWLVPYVGSIRSEALTMPLPMVGRGTYGSSKHRKLFIVIGSKVYTLEGENSASLIYDKIELGTTPIYIAENNGNQIIFCDGTSNKFYLYSFSTMTMTTVPVDFTPAYVRFQDGYFIAAEKGAPYWRLSALNNGTSWPLSYRMGITLEADVAIAAIPLPSRGGQLFVFGNDCTESWVNVGGDLFPYQKNSGYSIDYGCASAESIAHNEEMVVWLAVNKHSNPTIMYSLGAEAIPIATDGISYKLSEVKHRELAFGSLFKQDGHLIYQISFPAPEDNFSLMYDFTTKMFFNCSDSGYNYHPARHVELFNGSYYFVSYNDCYLYKLGTEYTTNNGELIPRSRITNTIRLPDSESFITDDITLIMEQGNSDGNSRIDLSLSRDGGSTFGNDVSLELNSLGDRKNKVMFRRLGLSNEITARINFWSKGRFIVGGGVATVHQ
jgi:hypothetical protein